MPISAMSTPCGSFSNFNVNDIELNGESEKRFNDRDSDYDLTPGINRN